VLIEKKKIMCIFISFYAYPSMELIKPSLKGGGVVFHTTRVKSNNATAANISGLDPSKTTPPSL